MFRAEHEGALAEVQSRIESVIPHLDQTARIKTIQTLHDKQRRQPTKLSRIQDIAGVRIVQDMDLLEQDAMVRDLTREFAEARVVDRRVDPSFGYRAVHIIVRVGRCQCEIQVRTVLQHTWAEIVERLADRWGRQIRYGGEPDDPDAAFGSSTTRREFWRAILNMSDIVHGLEEDAAQWSFAVASGEAPEGFGGADLEQLRRDLRDVMVSLEQFLSSGGPL